jgi:hypothetical protein
VSTPYTETLGPEQRAKGQQIAAELTELLTESRLTITGRRREAGMQQPRRRICSREHPDA